MPLYFYGKYSFIFEYSISVLFETSYGFKLGSDKVTNLGTLVTENYDERFIYVMMETDDNLKFRRDSDMIVDLQFSE